MYDETEPLEVPDTTSPSCVEALAATAIFIHLKKKAGGDNLRFAFSLPPALEPQQKFQTNISKSSCSLNIAAITYHVPLLCNTFFTTRGTEVLHSVSFLLSLSLYNTLLSRYGDSEELNRVVILTLARAVHIGGLEKVGRSLSHTTD